VHSRSDLVAIKVLPATFVGDADRLSRFEHEARVLSTVKHPNLLAIHGVGAQKGIHYLVAEFLEGQTLREKMRGVAADSAQGDRVCAGDGQGSGRCPRKGLFIVI
jgi:serine/threonine protein kinase